MIRKSVFALAAPIALLALGACDSVTSEPGDGTPVTINFAPCIGESNAPTWFAVQDGSGAWARVSATASGAYVFTLTSGKGGIAQYTPNDGLFIIFASSAELKANVPNCSGAVRSVSSSVTGYTSLDAITIQMGESGAQISGTQTAPAAFTLTGVGANVQDLVGVRSRTTATATTFQQTPNNVLIRRGVTGTTTAALDFTSTTEAGAPVARTVTVTNMAAGETLNVAASLVTNTTLWGLSFYQNSTGFFSGTASGPFHGLVSSRLASGESQMLNVSGMREISSSSEESRFTSVVYTDAVDKTVTLGPVLGTVTVAPSVRPSATYTIQTGYDQLWNVFYDQGSGASLRQVEVMMTRGYVGTAATSVTLTVPNLGGVSGFLSAWLPISGSVATWDFVASNADLSVRNSKAVTYLGAQRTNTFTP